MSHTQSSTAPTARDVKTLIKSTSASMTGKKRGPDKRVRRGSVDVDDRRATENWRPIAGGKKAAAMRWRDALRKTAREYDLVGKQKGRHGPLGQHALRVLDELLDLIDFATGRLDPSYARLIGKTGFARSTIASALRKLKAHRFLDWMRRTRLVDTDEGRARRQTSNAFFFAIGQLPKAVLQRFRDLLVRADRRAEARGTDTSLPPAAPTIQDPELASTIARIQARFDQGAE